MRIAFVSPKGVFFSNEPRLMRFWEKSKENLGSKLLATQFDLWSGFNLGLLILAALTPKKYEIEFIDENLKDINFEKHYDLVAISAITQQSIRAYQIADEFRKRKIKVVIGGIHATVLPDEAKQHADSIVIGEGEYSWPSLMKDLRKGELLPFYRSKESVDLKYSPLPRYNLLNPRDYRIVWIQTSRGCPFDCEFCAASKVFGLKFRHKTVKRVLQEIKLIKSIWKNPQINFSDDNMFIDRKYAEELIKELIPLNIRWAASTDISIAKDDKLLELLRKSGCIVLFIGFESLSKESLKNIDKRSWKLSQLSNYSLYIKKIQSYGIGVMGAFILGLDNDDKSIFGKTADFIINNHLYAAQITVLTPLPGTRLRERLNKEKRLLCHSWEKYSFLDVNFIPQKMSIKELQNGILQVYQRVYAKSVKIKTAEYFKNIYLDLLKNRK